MTTQPVADSTPVQPMLSIYNHHVPECGEPPSLDLRQRPQYYVGYFENDYGEQWIFTYDHDEQRGRLRGGDAHWDQEWPVINGFAQGVILNSAEGTWLAACWSAATGKPAIDPLDYIRQQLVKHEQPVQNG